MYIHKAHLFAVIDTTSNRVVQVLIMSDEKPTIVKSTLVYGLLSTTGGKSYAEAHATMRKQILTGLYWQWVRPLMGN